MNKYKIAIFDMDGTILNTLEDLWICTNYALSCYDMPERTLEEVRQFVGNGIAKLIERATPEGTTEELREQVLDTFKTYYKDHCADKTCPYEGIREVIKELRNQGVMTAVVSNKADFAVQNLCRDYFPGLFDEAVGEREGIRRKPAPDSVLSILQKHNLAREDAVYIGDSDVDLATSQNAGIDVIMVGWGFRDEAFILSKGAPFVIHNPKEICERVLNRM